MTTANALLEIAQQCGATVYRNRASPHEPAVAFGDESWARFAATLAQAAPDAEGVKVPQELPVAEIIECQKMGQQTVKEIDGRWRWLPIGTKLYAAPPAGAVAQPVAGSVKEEGPWRVMENEGKFYAASDDFTHDVCLCVDGDFACEEDERKYTAEICRRLNLAAPALKAAPASLTEIQMIEKAVLGVGMVSFLNHGAASCVHSEGCNGVTQDNLVAFAREIVLHARSQPCDAGSVDAMDAQDGQAAKVPDGARDLGRLNELAKVYASSYASPHHITFTVEGLRHLIEAVTPSQPFDAGRVDTKVRNRRQILASLTSLSKTLRNS